MSEFPWIVRPEDRWRKPYRPPVPSSKYVKRIAPMRLPFRFMHGPYYGFVVYLSVEDYEHVLQ